MWREEVPLPEPSACGAVRLAYTLAAGRGADAEGALDLGHQRDVSLAAAALITHKESASIW